MIRPEHVPEHLVVDYDAFGTKSIDDIFSDVAGWRDMGPVWWTDRNGGHWIVLSAAGCRYILTNPGLFISGGSAGIALVVIERERYIPIELDGSEHRAYRRAMNPLFAPARVNLLASNARDIAASLLKPLIGRGRCDIVHEYARPLASSMFLRLVDWPLDDRAMLENLVEKELNGVPGASSAEQQRIKASAHHDIVAYVSGKLAERKANPGEDMTSAIIRSCVGDEPIPDDMLVNMMKLLLIAGLDTTQSVTSRSIEYLAAHPDAQEFVRQHPDQMPTIVEEMLRFGAPATANREVASDVQVEGVTFRKGDLVHCVMPAANRDADEFASPHVIDFARQVNRHMTFGLGPHKCIGASLARVIISAALVEFHKVVPQYTLRSSSTHLGGIWGPNSVEIDFQSASLLTA